MNIPQEALKPNLPRPKKKKKVWSKEFVLRFKEAVWSAGTKDSYDMDGARKEQQAS